MWQVVSDDEPICIFVLLHAVSGGLKRFKMPQRFERDWSVSRAFAKTTEANLGFVVKLHVVTFPRGKFTLLTLTDCFSR